MNVMYESLVIGYLKIADFGFLKILQGCIPNNLNFLMLKEKGVIVFDGWPQNLDKFSKSFTPFLAKQVAQTPDQLMKKYFSCISERSEPIEISCQLKAFGDFVGDPVQREKVSMHILTFFEGFQCLLDRRCHWIHNLDFNLFLAQHTIYSRPSRCFARASELEPDNISCGLGFPSPLLVSNVILHQINIWANLFEATSSLHYDSFHNILIVLQGKKRVFLVSPMFTHSLNPYPADRSAPNHTPLLFSSVTQTSIPFLEYELNPGDALFIPEGWWHYVQSAEATFAVNYWFLSPFAETLEHAPHILEYALRSCIHECIDQRLEQFTNSKSHSPASNRLIKTSPTLNPQNKKRSCLEEKEAYSEHDYEEFKMLLKRYQNNKYRAQSFNVNLDYSSPEEEILVNNSFHNMEVYWVKFANDYPEEWINTLLLLSPRAVYMLTTMWDHLEMAASATQDSNCTDINRNSHLSIESIPSSARLKHFFSAIFFASPSSLTPPTSSFSYFVNHNADDVCSGLRKYFITQTDEFRRLIALNIEQDVLRLNRVSQPSVLQK
jgi:hypothetical protein